MNNGQCSSPRYARQLSLPQWGELQQQRLASSRVLMVGVGGLGSPVALYLVGAGLGQLFISDGDRVGLSNLHRQILYTQQDLNQPKTQAARRHLVRLNSACRVTALPPVDADNLPSLLAPQGQAVDLVLDCSDNLQTRQRVNAACVAASVPLLSGAVAGWQGLIALFEPGRRGTQGCYHCLFPTEQPGGDCAGAGILGPVAGLMACQQALEALRFLAGLPSPNQGSLLRYDGLGDRWQRLRLHRDPDCPICAPLGL